MKSKLIICIAFVLAFNLLHGQNKIAGSILDRESSLPIAYVNIGIVGKNVGTVSGRDGKFNLLIEPQLMNDSLLFSCIGFESLFVKISDITGNYMIHLKEKSYPISEVVVKPRRFSEQVFGITTVSERFSVGFGGRDPNGYEIGLLMKNKKRAVLKNVTVNICKSTADSLFFRLNVYDAKKKNNFKNILTEQIYVRVSKEEILEGRFKVNLEEKNITIDGDFLVSLEYVMPFPNSTFFFCADRKLETYLRTVSQGYWVTVGTQYPVGISLSVVADVENKK
jgi:hypothetical protein